MGKKTKVGHSDWLTLPPGLFVPGRLFAIGDVHGNAHLLEGILDWIEQEALPERAGEEADLVFLGDVIDRGHESFRALDLACRPMAGLSTCLLPGNHEIALMKFMAGMKGTFDTWINMGGASMLQEVHDMDGWATHPEIRRMIRARLPENFERDLMVTPTHLRRGSFLLVHAGLDPHARNPEQYLGIGMFGGDPATHWAMITDEFNDWEGGWERFGAGAVIHGHQPLLMEGWTEAVRTTHELLFHRRRLNLDFGSGIIDRLGGAQIEGERIRYFGVTG